MKAVLLKRALLAIFLVISPALAVHLLQVMSVDEYVNRLLHYPEDDIPLLQLDPKSLEHIQYWINRLTDRSLAIVGPCRLPGDFNTHVCRASASYPLFPLPDSYRNELLLRPPPDIVRAHIEEATNGKLSTVDELVEKVNTNFENLSVLSDDEVTLLATNFGEPTAGLTVGMGCGPPDYKGWSEDILVSQDEQRALLAGFLYAISNPGYIARQVAALEKYIQDRAQHDVALRQRFQERAERAASTRVQQCSATVSKGANRFRERVLRLDAEVILSETKWLARYDEYLAALRADVYALVPGREQGWNTIAPTLEKVVRTAEEAVDETICERIPTDEPAFLRFLGANRDAIQHEFPDLPRGIVQRLAHRRWKMLPPEKQAAYMGETGH